MKVLILTNSSHERFVGDVIKDVGGTHLIMTHRLDEKFSDYNVEYDVGISFMYQYKVPAKEVNTHTWFNFHPAPLPEYKGRNLCYHAIMNGEKEFGTTVHYMDEGFDSGRIIDCFRFQILEDETAESLSKFTIQQCKAQFQAYFPDILEGKIFETTENVGGTYFQKDSISDLALAISPDSFSGKSIRAIYYPPYYPKIRVGNVTYKLIKDD